MTTEEKTKSKRSKGSGQFSHIGNQLKQFRLLLQMEQYELAMLLKIDLDSVIDLENGLNVKPKKEPDYSRLVAEYGVNTTWLASGKGNIFNFKGKKTPYSVYLMTTLSFMGSPYSEYTPDLTRFFDVLDQLDRIEANQRKILERLGAHKQVAHLIEAV